LAEGPEPLAIVAGFKWMSSELQDSETGVLAVPATGNLDGVITEVIGDGAARALKKGIPVALTGEKRIVLLTERKGSRRYDWYGKPVLCCYPSKRLLDLLDEPSARIERIFVVPWLIDEIRFWIRAWEPIEIRIR